MRLQEEYNRIIQAKNAARKQAEDISAKDHLLCEEIQRIYTGDNHKGYGYDTGNGKYYYSLPIKLPPESRNIVQELIELCPPQIWWSPMTNISIRSADGCPCSFDTWAYLQYRLADGSVHVGEFRMNIPKKLPRVKPAFRFTQEGKQAARLEAQEKMRQLALNAFPEVKQQLEQMLTQNPGIIGAWESVQIPYISNRRNSSGDNISGQLFVFQDGTLFDPYPLDGPGGFDAPFSRRFSRPESTGEFYRLCSLQVKAWAQQA